MGLDAEKIKEKSPFSIYDFFGYLFPGFFLVISVWVLCVIEGFRGPASLEGPVKALYEQILAMSSGGILSKAFLLSIAVVAVYALGHAVATVSHILLDRFFMQRVLGYPTLSYLAIPDTGEFQTSGYVIAFSFALVALAGSCIRSFGSSLGGIIVWTGFLGSVVGIAGVGIVAILKGFLALKCYKKKGKPDHYLSGATATKIWKRHVWIRRWSSFYGKSFGLLVKILRGLLSLEKPLCKDVQDGIFNQLELDFGITKLTNSSDIFWLSYYRVSQLSASVDGQIRNWINMYGYCRNFAVAALVVPGMIMVHQLMPGYEPSPWEGWMSLMFLGLFTLFLLRYVLLYSSYYTKNTLRAYYVLTRKTDEPELAPA